MTARQGLECQQLVGTNAPLSLTSWAQKQPSRNRNNPCAVCSHMRLPPLTSGRQSLAMLLGKSSVRLKPGVRSARRLPDRFYLLPIAVEALQSSSLSCRHCEVKLLDRKGLIGGMCPSCFEERCAKCGRQVLGQDGEFMPGLTVGRGASWNCAGCATPAARRRAARLLSAKD